MHFLKQVYAEMSKVIWPSRDKTALYTGMVVIISVVVAYYLGLFDYIFQTYGLKALIS